MSRTIEVERRMRARPETIFPYFTDPALAVQWQGTYAELDPRPGGRYVFHYGEGPRIRGTYLVVEPPRRLVIAWGWERAEGSPLEDVKPASTRFEVTLVPDGDDTLVRVKISELPTDVARDAATWGTHTYIDRLAAVVEGNHPGPDPVVALADRT